jgi:predicted RNA-binding Zn-ribbon protein involved in translation (DUF1610 family)
MAQVRKENSESLEYVCPECGATFDEGAEDCASCGIEFDWSEEMEYLCPQCGTVVDPDQARCPGCAAKFSMHDDGEILIEYEPDAPKASDEDLLEAAIDEVIVRPNGTIVMSEDMEEDVQDRGMGDVPAEEPPDEGWEEMEEETDVEDVPVTEAEPTASYPRLYPGGFTLVGLIFAILALMALAFSILVARYDTWIQGAAEESMGDNQLMFFYAGLIAFAVFIIIAVADLLRTPRPKPTT